MRIGELAHRFDLNPRTIRYYESIGLLAEPSRTAAGYRQYDEAVARRLAFIQRAKRLGFSLDQIRAILSLHEHGEQPCPQVLALIDDEVAQIEHRLSELAQLRNELISLRQRWADTASQRSAVASVCPIVEESTSVASRLTQSHPFASARRIPTNGS